MNPVLCDREIKQLSKSKHMLTPGPKFSRAPGVAPVKDFQVSTLPDSHSDQRRFERSARVLAMPGDIIAITAASTA